MTSPINKDYARRPELIGYLDHVEWMKRPTFRALQWIRERKESEFKKPYREDDHVPMEHWADYPFPVFTFPPFPNFPGPVPPADSPWNLRPGEKEEEPTVTVCPPWCMCAPGNPETIVAGGSSVVLNVLACGPPNEITITIHEDNYFKVKTQPIWTGGGMDWAFSILAEADACGLCTIIISCSDGSGTICYLRCDNGVWVEKSTGVCVLSGCGTEDPAYTFTLIEGYQKQVQTTLSGGSASCWCPADDYTDCYGFCSNNEYCGATPPDNCIDCNPDHVFPGRITYSDTCPTLRGIVCYCVSSLTYYEWECP